MSNFDAVKYTIGFQLGWRIAPFPGLLRFYLPFVFTIILESGRQAQNREGLGTFIM